MTSPARRNVLFVGISGLLLAGMFSAASASNRQSAPHQPDPVAAAQTEAADTIVRSSDESTLDSLTRLHDSDPKNAVYSYLIAALHARRQEWRLALTALQTGNEAPQLVFARSVDSQGDYPALSILRQLVADCTQEATRSDAPETSDALLQESAVLAGRLAREAQPCDLTVLQTAGALWRDTERARIASWEKQERFVDADAARARLASRARWNDQVEEKIAMVNLNDNDVRTVAAKALRNQLPR